jgi:hypothetical protein
VFDLRKPTCPRRIAETTGHCDGVPNTRYVVYANNMLNVAFARHAQAPIPEVGERRAGFDVEDLDAGHVCHEGKGGRSEGVHRQDQFR